MTNQNPDACVHCGREQIQHFGVWARLHPLEVGACPLFDNRCCFIGWHLTNRFTSREQFGQCSAEGRTQSTQPLHGTLPVVKAAEVARPHVEQVSSPATVQPSEWRELGPDELIQLGDEWTRRSYINWEGVPRIFNGTPRQSVVDLESWVFRRRVQPPTASPTALNFGSEQIDIRNDSADAAQSAREILPLPSTLALVLKANMGFMTPGSDYIRVNDVIADLQSQLAAERERAERAQKLVEELANERDNLKAFWIHVKDMAIGMDNLGKAAGVERHPEADAPEADGDSRNQPSRNENATRPCESKPATFGNTSGSAAALPFKAQLAAERERMFAFLTDHKSRYRGVSGHHKGNDVDLSVCNACGMTDGHEENCIVYILDRFDSILDDACCERDMANAAYIDASEENDRLKREVEELRNGLGSLLDKLEDIHNDSTYQSVWTLYTLHNGQYSGPNYAEEYKKARALAKRKDGQ